MMIDQDDQEITLTFTALDDAVITEAEAAFGRDDVSASSRMTGGTIVDVFIRPTLEFIGKVLDFRARHGKRLENAKVMIGKEQISLEGYGADDAERLLSSPGHLDTSSLVKLYVREDGSDDVAGLVERADIVATSVVAYPETRSAFARLAREGALDEEGLAAVRNGFQRDWASFLRVRVLNRVYQRAGDLVDQYSLRGFDALHLASYLEILGDAGDEPVAFSAFDTRLTAAADAERPPRAEAPLE